MSTKFIYPNTEPTLRADFANSKRIPPEFQYSRASTGTYVGSDGLFKTAQIGEPRFDHNPITGESLGLLVEEARTNIIVSSSVFNTGQWVQDGVVLAANAGVAPDGTTTATSVSQGTGNNRCYHFDNNGAGSKSLTVFAKSNAGSSITLSGNLSYGTNFAGSAVLNTANGTVSTALGCSSVAFPNGWYRFVIPINVSFGAGNSNYLSLSGPASSVFVWGAQLEAGSSPTSYIPTTTATVTRAADTLTVPTSKFLNASNSSIVVESESTINNSPVISLNDGTTFNETKLIVHPTAGISRLVVTNDIVRSGLVLNLDAGNPASYPGSGTTWNNLVNPNSSFSLVNSPTYLNNTFTFDGVDDYASSTTSNFLKWQNWNKLSLTIAFKHISATGQTSNRQYLLDFSGAGVNGIIGLFVDNPSTLRELTLFYNTTGTSYEEPTITTYNFNTWNIYCFTFDKTTSSNNIRHYINGVNVFNRSITANSTETNGDGTIWIGRYGGGGFLFNGEISHISANVGTILSAAEVQQNFNGIRSRYGI